MARNPIKGNEMAFIDCSMIVVTTEGDSPKSVGITSGTQLGVEPQLETTDAVRLIIKGVLKAQKPEKQTITGHTLTLTDNLTILELIEILQGGTVTRDEQGKITGYTPPVVGEEYKPQKFTLDAYSAQLDEGGNVLAYEKISYPGCSGQPVGLGSEDNVFRVNEYTINSAPGKGQAPYTITLVDELPTLDDAPTLGTLQVVSAEGTASGATKLTVTPAKAGGNSYKYKVDVQVTMPAYDEVCDSGYTDWDGAADITAATGQKILVVEVDSANKAKAAGTTTVTAKA